MKLSNVLDDIKNHKDVAYDISISIAIFKRKY